MRLTRNLQYGRLGGVCCSFRRRLDGIRLQKRTFVIATSTNHKSTYRGIRSQVSKLGRSELCVIPCGENENARASVAAAAAAAMFTSGAVLLRGAHEFSTTPEGFSGFAQQLASEFPEWTTPVLSWDSGHRYTLAPGVTNSASDLPSQIILPHCEHQDMPRSPVYVLFACVIAATEGGATPIYDLQLVQRWLEKDRVGARLIEDLRNEGVKISRFYPGADCPEAVPIRRANFAALSDKFPELQPGASPAGWERLKRSFDEHSVEYQWEGCDADGKDGTSLRLQWHNPAFVRHPLHGYEVFYYGYGTHASYFDAEIPDVPYHNQPFHNRLGCGREVTPDELAVLDVAFQQAATRFEWRNGDVICIDNFRFAHGRDP